MSVRWLRGNRSDAEDVVSFAALKALDFLERHPAGVQQFRPWALRIVRNLCADVRRQRMRRSELSADTEVSDEVADRPSSEVAPDRALLRHELIPALDDAVAELSPSLRSTFHLRYFDDLPYDEICRRLEISPENARKRIENARKRLRLRLASYAL